DPRPRRQWPARRRALVPAVLTATTALLIGCKDRPHAQPDQTAADPTTETTAETGAETATETAASAAEPTGPFGLSSAAIARASSMLRSEQWYGCYIAGQKVGYAHVWVRPNSDDEPGGYVSAYEMVFRSQPDPPDLLSSDSAEPAVGAVEDLRIEEYEYYSAKPPFELVETRSVEQSPEGRLERVAIRHDPADGSEPVMIMRQTADGDGEPGKARTLPASRATVGPILALSGAATEFFHRAGARAEYAEFDLDRAGDRHYTLVVRAVHDERIAGVATRVAEVVITTEDDPVPIELRVADGITLDMVNGAIRCSAEDESTATSNVTGIGVLTFAVPATLPDGPPHRRRLGDPSKVRELSAIIEGPADLAIPSRPNQRVSELAPGRFAVELKAAPGAPVTADERAKALEITPNIDADHPDIAALAAALKDGARSDREVVRRLRRWVARNLDGNLSTSLSTASQVLDKRTGDCTEYTVLFVALARAAGIPARELSGLVYMGDRHRAFGWHAWAEVAIDGHWVQVDPSWDEDVANATHIVLGIADRDVSAQALGALRIELTRWR
ncbi:MAG: transglutaminase domain-containing protein, partial [Myxococcota bacterium]